VQFSFLSLSLLISPKNASFAYLFSVESWLAAAEFAKAYEVMAQSMLVNINPSNIAKIQRDIETGLVQAESIDNMLEYLMGMSEGMLPKVMDDEDSAELKEVLAELVFEVKQEALGVSEAKIEDSLHAIEEQLRR
jgi:hypothetical protein